MEIKIERIFNIVGVIIGLRLHQLEIENLNKLILITKNWLDDPKFEFTSGPESVEKYFDIANGMVSKDEDLIIDFNLFEKI